MLTVTITGNFANPIECFDFFALLARMGVSPTVVADDRKAHPTDQVVTAEATGTMHGSTAEADAAPIEDKPTEEKIDKRKTSRKVATREAAASVAGGEQPVTQTTAPPVNPAPPPQQPAGGNEDGAIQAMRDKINQMLAVKKGAQVAGLMGKYKAATVREVHADKRANWMADADRIIAGDALST